MIDLSKLYAELLPLSRLEQAACLRQKYGLSVAEIAPLLGYKSANSLGALLSRARKAGRIEGKHFTRAQLHERLLRAAELRLQGKSWREIARELDYANAASAATATRRARRSGIVK